jgi:CHRD domain-containing protein
MKRLVAVITATTLLLGVVGVAMANGESDRNSFKARLGGYQEVPAINTTGAASLKATVNSAGTVLTYTLTYQGLSGPAGAAHIHFGQPGVNGAVVLWLCGGGGKPACPAAGVAITGTVNAGDVAALPGVAAQGMVAGDLASVLKAMRAGVAYANIHTAAFPGGEIRGQIGGRRNGDNDNH